MAEDQIRDAGYEIVRVRCEQTDDGDVATIEVEPSRVDQLLHDPQFDGWRRRFLQSGFVRVEVQRDGFRSGRLNDAIQSPLVMIGGQDG